MRKLISLFLLLTGSVLAGCGGSDDTLSNPNAGLPPGTTPPADIATLTLLTSTAAVASDGSETATITALVRDTNNNVVENISVVFLVRLGQPGGQPTRDHGRKRTADGRVVDGGRSHGEDHRRHGNGHQRCDRNYGHCGRQCQPDFH